MKVPTRLNELLGHDQELKGTVTSFLNDVTKITAENHTTFFPNYTDHGCSHIELVLDTAERLIKNNAHAALAARDAAVLICAVALHDIALHISEAGFLELIAGKRFRPRPWFDSQQEGRTADLPWPELWENFRREIKSSSSGELELILGGLSPSLPKVVLVNPCDLHEGGNHSSQRWTKDDRLIIGEFIRRHHPRIAHEVAHDGFPGVKNATGFALHQSLSTSIIEAVGAVARSHGESPRQFLSYLDNHMEDRTSPWNCKAVFLMGVLQIADFAQIDQKRAPQLLREVKGVMPNISALEWEKHSAVDSVVWDCDDPRAIKVTANTSHSLETHLAVEHLLRQFQQQLDDVSAVLREVYKSDVLSELSKVRVKDDLKSPSTLNGLEYLPRDARLKSDPNLFRLLIRDLYGDEPTIAVRELVQNAVDAVRAREALEGSSANRDFEVDAPINVALATDAEDGSWTLTVADSGIGMDEETIINSFLVAGKSFVDVQDGAEKPLKIGRFGVGSLAAFLFGNEVEIETRKFGTSNGFSFRFNQTSRVIEIKKNSTTSEIGTTVKVTATPERVSEFIDRRGLSSSGMTPEKFFELSSEEFSEFLADIIFSINGSVFEDYTQHRVPVERCDLDKSDNWIELPQEEGLIWFWSGGHIQRGRTPDEFDSNTLWINGVHIGRRNRSNYSYKTSPIEWSDPDFSSLLGVPALSINGIMPPLETTINRYQTTSPCLNTKLENDLVASMSRQLIVDLLGNPDSEQDLPYPLQLASTHQNMQPIAVLPASTRVVMPVVSGPDSAWGTRFWLADSYGHPLFEWMEAWSAIARDQAPDVYCAPLYQHVFAESQFIALPQLGASSGYDISSIGGGNLEIDFPLDWSTSKHKDLLREQIRGEFAIKQLGITLKAIALVNLRKEKLPENEVFTQEAVESFPDEYVGLGVAVGFVELHIQDDLTHQGNLIREFKKQWQVHIPEGIPDDEHLRKQKFKSLRQERVFSPHFDSFEKHFK